MSLRITHVIAPTLVMYNQLQRANVIPLSEDYHTRRFFCITALSLSLVLLAIVRRGERRKDLVQPMGIPAVETWLQYERALPGQ